MKISGKRFLITGGSSLVGSRIASRLLEGGASGVVLYDNLSLGTMHQMDALLADDRVSFIQGDILELDDLTVACEGVDGVFALAAFLTIPLGRNPRLGLRVNVDGMGNTLEAAHHSGVNKVVLASSISVYGDSLQDSISETTPFGSATLSPPFALYALSKLIGEQLGKLYSSQHGLEFNSVRFSTVYGERQHDRGVNALQMVDAYHRIRAGEAPIIVGTGDDAHDYIYVGDAADGAIKAMEHGRTGEAYTIATGVSSKSRDVVDLVTRLSGSSLSPVFVPDERVSKPTMNEDLLLDVDAARRNLSWSAQVSIEEGVARLLHWLDEQENQ
ncbi:NAD-dependent epimerase/dehydratase family protein [Cryobacterium sp. Y62]|uniref:NAD-dependent epimerase/dehydratase family protein n=1 Tax=Cryobacterium sp. Y62 TaxID=2048284 RepID=UPI000CE53027|nr:NAD-dependent epimerase/dehydratase family protein [Cryobacterium sp. Y62]